MLARKREQSISRQPFILGVQELTKTASFEMAGAQKRSTKGKLPHFDKRKTFFKPFVICISKTDASFHTQKLKFHSWYYQVLFCFL